MGRFDRESMEDGLERGRRDTKPLVLKLGVALALSLAGYFASQLRFRPRLPPPPSKGTGPEASGKASVAGACGGSGGLKDELHILTREEDLAKIINGTSTTDAMAFDSQKEEPFVRTFNGTSTRKSFGEEEEDLNAVVLKEFEANPGTTPSSPMGNELEIKEGEAMEQDIAYLRNLVKSLQERERSLEIEMLEYYGLKEQENALREFENRVKVNTMEAKLLSLKVESLQADNQRLQAQVSDYPRIKVDLETEREKVTELKKKIKSDGEQVKEKITALHQRISELQERELRDGEAVEKKLRRLKELEDETIDLRKVNSRLAQENLELEQKLKSTQMPSSSVLKSQEVESLEEVSRMREENEKLKKEIEQLQTDRCTDVEELVYLRWVNACLRYELRNYQPPPGKTVARDLSRCLSPKSEEKAKQLILEYAHSGTNEKNMGILDFDSEICSYSQSSDEECSDTSIDISISTKNSSSSKSKFISKLKKLVLGKDSHRSKISSADRTLTGRGHSERRVSISTCSFEDIIGRRNSYDSNSSCISVEHALNSHLPGLEVHGNEQWQNKGSQSQSFSRSSLDIQRLGRLDSEVEKGIGVRCKSDIGTSLGYKRMISGDDCLGNLSYNNSINHEDNVPEKAKLKRFAEVLKSSRGSLKLKKRLQSFRSS